MENRFGRGRPNMFNLLYSLFYIKFAIDFLPYHHKYRFGSILSSDASALYWYLLSAWLEQLESMCSRVYNTQVPIVQIFKPGGLYRNFKSYYLNILYNYLQNLILIIMNIYDLLAVEYNGARMTHGSKDHAKFGRRACFLNSYVGR